MRAFGLYAVITITLVFLVGWALALGFHGPGDATAIRLSGILAVVVQVAAFGAIRLLGPRKVVVGWGIGALLRLVTLAVYGLMVIKGLVGVPAIPALIALATFFFLTTLIEPLLLKL